MSRAIFVVPCYQEAERLDPQAFLSFMERDADVDFWFVDDGSSDGTAGLVEALRAQRPERVTVQRLPSNVGKAEAVRQGVQAARTRPVEYVGYLDADLATPLSELRELIATMDRRPEVVLAMGARVRLLGRQIERSALRHYLGRVFATAVSLGLSLPVYDTQCGVKLFRNVPELAQLFGRPFLSRWIFDVEVLERLIRLRQGSGAPAVDAICEVPLGSWSDVRGSKLRLRDFARAFPELIWILYRERQRSE